MRKILVKLFVAAALVIAGAFNANAQMGGGFQMDPDGIAKMICSTPKRSQTRLAPALLSTGARTSTTRRSRPPRSRTCVGTA